MPVVGAIHETVMAEPLTVAVRLVGTGEANVRVAVRVLDHALSPAVLWARTRYR